eukprot:TRINITY_DN125_c1_g1_i1.p1 TRINITY_DN125_c1_g1~~TRINITY_DN125_c1_g1_i1.p1  ORF type:complete len:746 (+),score=337.14 TRINITY_DN125_c1_g1_i1:3-2240(+)
MQPQTTKFKNVSFNPQISENEKFILADKVHLEKIYKSLNQLTKTASATIEDEKKTAETFRSYSSALRELDSHSVISRCVEAIGNFMQICADARNKLNLFIQYSLCVPLKKMVKEDITSALETKARYDRAISSYDSHLSTRNSKKNTKPDDSGAKQSFDQVEMEAKFKMQDTCAKNNFQVMLYLCNLIESFQDCISTCYRGVSQLQTESNDFKTSSEKMRDDFLTAQTKRPLTMKPVKPAFGVPINDVFERDNCTGESLPPFLEVIFTHLVTESTNIEGLFRVPANKDEVLGFKNLINQGSTLDFKSSEHDPHVVSSLLSTWLRELPEPLLTFENYDKFIGAKDILNDPSQIEQLKIAIQSLPNCNRIVLKYLISMLAKVANNSETNKMSPTNLAIVMGPTILYPKVSDLLGFESANRVVEGLIVNCDTLFGVNSKSSISRFPKSAGSKRPFSIADVAKVVAATALNTSPNTTINFDLIQPQASKRLTTQLTPSVPSRLPPKVPPRIFNRPLVFDDNNNNVSSAVEALISPRSPKGFPAISSPTLTASTLLSPTPSTPLLMTTSTFETSTPSTLSTSLTLPITTSSTTLTDIDSSRSVKFIKQPAPPITNLPSSPSLPGIHSLRSVPIRHSMAPSSFKQEQSHSSPSSSPLSASSSLSSSSASSDQLTNILPSAKTGLRRFVSARGAFNSAIQKDNSLDSNDELTPDPSAAAFASAVSPRNNPAQVKRVQSVILPPRPPARPKAPS